MTRVTRLGWINCIVLLAALACAGAWASGQVRSMRDRSEVAKMTEKMKTVCVGRFLVDVPTRAEVTLSREMMDGFEIETLEESATGFRDRVTERESEIAEHDQHDDTAGGNGLVSARDLRVPSMIGRVLVFGRTRSYSIKGGRRVDDEWVSIEAHAHLDGLSFSLSL